MPESAGVDGVRLKELAEAAGGRPWPQKLRLAHTPEELFIAACDPQTILGLLANLRAATDLVVQAEKLIPGFGATFTRIVIGDTAEARARAEAAEARVEELTQALDAIARNAEGWHGSEPIGDDRCS